jgi:hypothetical protein
VTARIPLLTVHAGRSAPGQRAASSHTAAAAAPLITREALFEQAGIVATTSLGELIDVAALMASQPIPAGRVVAIVSNSGGAGVLAADACAEAGLVVATTDAQTRDRLREVLPAGSAVGGPVDTTAAVGAEAFREALHVAGTQDGVDALLAVVIRRGPADLLPVLADERWPVSVVAAVLGQPGRPAAVRRRFRSGLRVRARVRLPGSGRPGAGSGRPLRLLAIPAGRDGARAVPRASGRRVHDHGFLPGADAGRWLAVRWGG